MLSVSSNKKPAWSYSVINKFETCPKQYFHENILKDFRQAENEHSAYGKDVHRAFELRVSKGKPLPLNLRHHESSLIKFVDAPGEKHCEMKLALNHKFEPVDWFAADVFCRAIVDLLIINGKTAIIVDYKTGKLKDNFEQLNLAAAILLKYAEELEHIKLIYFWIKEKKITSKSFTPDMASQIWQRYLIAANRLAHACEHEEFPAKPNGLCERYCSVRSCAYNGTKIH